MVTKKVNTKDTVIYPVVRPSVTLAYSTLWRPNGRGLHSTPFKWSNDQLEYHGVFLSFSFSRLRGISTTWSLSPLQLMITKKHGSKGGKSNTHKTQNQSTITHTSHNLSSRERPVRRKPAWRTGHCPVHHRTVRCARPSWVLAAPAKSFSSSLFFDSST
jgi:hypothetical protein